MNDDRIPPSLAVARQQCIETVLRCLRDNLMLAWNCLSHSNPGSGDAENALSDSVLNEIVGAYNRIDALLLKIRQQRAQTLSGQQPGGVG